ncbi:MAG: hypothetical protein RSC34_02060 [Alistipes sp.]
MNENKLYQAPELNVWSIAAEQGFAASSNFQDFEEKPLVWE